MEQVLPNAVSPQLDWGRLVACSLAGDAISREEGRLILALPDEVVPEALRAACADCGLAIAHMPHAPLGPPKVCNACAVLRVRAAHP